MPFTIIRQDITKMQVDAIVNAANTQLAMGGGVCGAIFNAAGKEQLAEACSKLAPIKTGEAAITPGFELGCKYIIHAAGPVYRAEQAEKCEEQLYSAYTSALDLAYENGCESIAFPLISSGIYAYPKNEALRIASSAIEQFISERDINVYLTVFDKDAFIISEKLLGAIKSYIDENYVGEHTRLKRAMLKVESTALEFSAEECLSAGVQPEKPTASAAGIEELIKGADEPFGAVLLKLIDAKGKTDAQVYKKANIDRKLFSKIRTGKGYTPGKRTILALCISLELSLKETTELLRCAGYALSHSSRFDIIVEYFIVNNRYDIYEINEVLFSYDQPLLGI